MRVASRTTARLTPNCPANSGSVGRSAPLSNSPDRMAVCTVSAICSAIVCFLMLFENIGFFDMLLPTLMRCFRSEFLQFGMSLTFSKIHQPVQGQ